jgi:uncharacterized membrane protein
MMGYGFGLFHMVIILFVWLGLILLAIWLIGILFPAAPKKGGVEQQSPAIQELLKAHYDRGELTSEQYQEMLQLIHHS